MITDQIMGMLEIGDLKKLQVPKGWRLYYCFAGPDEEPEGLNLVEKGPTYSVWYKLEKGS